MAVTSVNLLPSGREGEFSAQRKGLLFEIVNRKYQLRYQVTTSTFLDGPESVLLGGGAFGLPVMGSSYFLGNDNDSIATCTDLKAEPTEHPQLWHVSAVFDTDRLVSAAVTNPLNMPPEVSWGDNMVTKPMYRDLLGVPCVNSANYAFEPPLTYEDNRPVLTVTRNESAFNFVQAYAYKGACNLDTFGPAPPYHAKLTQLKGVKQVDIGVSYYKVTYEVEFRNEGHFSYVLDRGFNDKDRKLYPDPLTGIPLAEPTLMNGRGYSWLDAKAHLTADVAETDTTIDVDYPSGTTVSNWPPLAQEGAALTVPPDWYFEVRIDNEVMQVTDTTSGGIWSVTRGFAGSARASHVTNAKITLEPYFRRYLPARVLPFAPLSLPLA